MSTLPENELDLEKLFLPAWAQEPASTNRYAKYSGEEGRDDRRDDRRGPRGPRREGGPRPDRGNRPPRSDQPGRPSRPFGGRRDDSRGPRPAGGPEGGRRFDDRREREHREPPPPLPEVNIRLVPDVKGVEHLARQIKMTGRAYPLFDIAQMILQKPERHGAVFSVKKKPDGTVAQPLFVCALDDSLWLSESEVVAHVLRLHFATFYQSERTATEPPKGKYTFVAQCGMSGTIFGPPNYHDYQNRVRALHAERFSRMPFEVYKARIKIVRDEEVVKKWVEDQSWKTEYVCLNVPEPLKLGSMEAVERHFRETHAATIIKQVETHTLSGTACRNIRCRDLSRLARQAVDDQRRFPLQLATTLSQQFASHGLQFFKVNKTVTHVSVARPHYLDVDATPVSENIRRIVSYINANPKCTHRRLVEALAPTPLAPPAPASVAAPAPQEVASAEAAAPETAAAPAEAAPAVPPAPAAPQPTAAQTEIIADLHWLVHQGHVIEFANGVLETAKKPLPKPPKPEPKTAAAPAGAAAATTPEAATATAEEPACPAPVAETSPTAVGGESPIPAASEITPAVVSEPPTATEASPSPAVDAPETPAPKPVEPGSM